MSEGIRHKILDRLSKDESKNADDDAARQTMFDANVKYILSREDKLYEKLKDGDQLERVAADVAIFISLIKDYVSGNYRKIPFKSISAIVVALVYILNPIDIIPDFIPVIGHIDDAFVVTFCLKALKKDLQKYKDWKQGQRNSAKTDS